MLHLFLAELPNALFKEVVESPPEEFEDRISHGLEFQYKVDPLEAHIQWLFPMECDMSSLVGKVEVGKLLMMLRM
ncbi:hypothetical protein ACHQM5_026765 [Ranunculus cassubicifolius]